MSTSVITDQAIRDLPARPRVWLVGGCSTSDPRPDQLPAVRDSLGHVWWPREDGLMHMTAAGQHHASWHELRARYDLVEVA
jgi:hypothetical protein